MINVPKRSELESVNDIKLSQFPSFVRSHREYSQKEVNDIQSAVSDAVSQISEVDHLSPGSEVGVTVGSRGITNIKKISKYIVQELDSRGLDPFIIPAMGSHGGATEEGQVKVLASLGITEKSMGCDIRPSMDVRMIGRDSNGHEIYIAQEALESDAIILANRIKIHTDFVDGVVESGLCKMAVIGLGKQYGAEVAHNAATASSFREILPEWGPIIADKTPIIGGVGIIENANEETAVIEGVNSSRLLEKEKRLFEQSIELFPMLPVDNIDLLIIDEIGKHISGTGMDTNVIGRMLIHGEPEPSSPEVTRIYVRSLTKKTDGNGLGIGLADFVHERAVNSLNLRDTYINAITGSEPERARIPMIVPTDATAFLSAYSTSGVDSPKSMRILRIKNTAELSTFMISDPIANDIASQQDMKMDQSSPVSFSNGELSEDW